MIPLMGPPLLIEPKKSDRGQETSALVMLYKMQVLNIVHDSYSYSCKFCVQNRKMGVMHNTV
jgi:hypothetical protein